MERIPASHESHEVVPEAEKYIEASKVLINKVREMLESSETSELRLREGDYPDSKALLRWVLESPQHYAASPNDGSVEIGKAKRLFDALCVLRMAANIPEVDRWMIDKWAFEKQELDYHRQSEEAQ